MAQKYRDRLCTFVTTMAQNPLIQTDPYTDRQSTRVDQPLFHSTRSPPVLNQYMLFASPKSDLEIRQLMVRDSGLCDEVPVKHLKGTEYKRKGGWIRSKFKYRN